MIDPAKASYPFANDIGPDEDPPDDKGSPFPLRFERLTPEPEPCLKINPSVLARSSMDSISSSTLFMKHAEHWGCSSAPQLNHTGELNDAC